MNNNYMMQNLLKTEELNVKLLKLQNEVYLELFCLDTISLRNWCRYCAGETLLLIAMRFIKKMLGTYH